MARGMYTAPARVVRDGRLVCFKGETMSRAEAERRGLLPADPPAAAPTAAVEPESAPAGDPAGEAGRLVKGNTAEQLRAMADAAGVPYPNGATKAVIAEAIVAAGAGKAV